MLRTKEYMGMKRLVQRALSAIVFASLLAWTTTSFAQSESVGVNQYFNNCASCHESNEPGRQAPPTSALKRMTPERILEVLTTGSMRSAVPALSDQDKRLIAEWVSGRKLDSDLAGAAAKMTNVCDSHPQVRESNAPAWNGWGVDYRNSRFQSSAAAGLSPGQVSRLQLKWAFGFPGATALYGQTVYDGRLYVTSNAGYVYSLDAETGCLHWSFRAQAAVRSGFSVGRLNRTGRTPRPEPRPRRPSQRAPAPRQPLPHPSPAHDRRQPHRPRGRHRHRQESEPAVPKMKSHKAAQKRLGVTGSGKVYRVRAWRGHHLEIKSSRRTRRYAGSSIVGPEHAEQVRRLLPYL